MQTSLQRTDHGVAKCGVSAAGGKARGETRRKVGSEDSVLGGFEVVGCAVEVDDLGIRIEQGKGGAPIAIARLADGAGIDQVTSG